MLRGSSQLNWGPDADVKRLEACCRGKTGLAQTLTAERNMVRIQLLVYEFRELEVQVGVSEAAPPPTWGSSCTNREINAHILVEEFAHGSSRTLPLK